MICELRKTLKRPGKTSDSSSALQNVQLKVDARAADETTDKKPNLMAAEVNPRVGGLTGKESRSWK
ncbi:hypothetical protein E2C01_014173 [Portunus trituberculatus]|uniref:Uncharacterized protein n=1 Tax=Portunus trituberculatus TaxID=210409 RepID=A0A5B7DJI6_PORTR|nr:hypothetical protein [Portunus trituberculatus]